MSSHATSLRITKQHEMDAFLKNLGFEPTRQNGKDKVYSNGVDVVSVPRYPTLEKMTSIAIQQKAMKLWEKRNLTAKPLSVVKEEEEKQPESAGLVLSRDKLVFNAIVDACQRLRGKTLKICDVMRFTDYTQNDFNRIVRTASNELDLDVLFSLRDSLALVNAHSRQIRDGIEKLENATKPAEDEPVKPIYPWDKSNPIIAKSDIEMTKQVEVKTEGMSPKQVAYISILNTLQPFTIAEAEAIIAQINNFIKLR